jgi:hypothetical protein
MPSAAAIAAKPIPTFIRFCMSRILLREVSQNGSR